MTLRNQRKHEHHQKHPQRIDQRCREEESSARQDSEISTSSKDRKRLERAVVALVDDRSSAKTRRTIITYRNSERFETEQHSAANADFNIKARDEI
jgi:hypothetical protein